MVIHFKTILKGIGFFFHLLTPLFIGIMIAFVFNRPFEMFQRIYHNKWKLKKTPAKILAIITIYILALSVGILLLFLVIPEVIKNLNMFISNANIYLNQAQEFINRVTVFLGIPNIDL